MTRSTKPAVLNKIPVTKWVLGTARKMATAARDDSGSWNNFWHERYCELGGRARTTGRKPCPMAAGYGLWYLGLLAGGSRPRLGWSVERVNQQLGKNATYAVMAAQLLAEGVTPEIRTLWPLVKERYKKQMKQEPANSEQGEIKLVIALFREKQLVGTRQQSV